MTVVDSSTRVPHRRPNGGKNVVDRTGHRYGRLTVLERAGSRGTSAAWLCLCDCGNQKVIVSNSLRAGAKSCGCARSTGPGSRPTYRCSVPPGLAARNKVLKNYRLSALSRGIAWDLPEDVFDRLTSADCHYCGICPNTLSAPSRNGQYLYNGIDRIDNLLGYVANNVIPCCSVCNHAKHTMSMDAFLAWIDRIVRYAASRRSA